MQVYVFNDPVFETPCKFTAAAGSVSLIQQELADELHEVGLCYSEDDESSYSLLYDHGELFFYQWNLTGCTGVVKNKTPFGVDVNRTCSIMIPSMQFKTYGPESFNVTQHGVRVMGLEFFGDTCEMSSDKFTYKFWETDLCIPTEDDDGNTSGSFKLTTNSSGVYSHTFSDTMCHNPTSPEEYGGPHEFLFKQCTPLGEGEGSIMAIDPTTASQDLVSLFGGSASDFPFMVPPPSEPKTWTYMQFVVDDHFCQNF